MTCKNCGTELPESSKFCTKCGTPTAAEEMNISAAGVERAVPKGFSAKKNIIIIIIAAILLIGGGITAIAVVNSHSASSGVSDKLQLAERYLNEQNYEQAVIEFQKVLEIEPMNVDAYLGLADAYLGMGDTDKALEWLNKGFELTGDARIQKKLDALTKSETSPGETSSSDNSQINNSFAWENTASDVFGVDIRQIHNATGLGTLGRGVYYYNLNNSNTIDGFVRIDEEKFEKTGELSFTDIKTEGFDFSTEDYDFAYNDISFDDGDYITLHDAKDEYRLAIKYDEANNAIIRYRELPNQGGQIVSSNGTTVSAKIRGVDSSIVVTATRADGSTFENVFEDYYPWDGIMDEDGNDFYGIYVIPNSSKYCYGINYNAYNRSDTSYNSMFPGNPNLLRCIVDHDGDVASLPMHNGQSYRTYLSYTHAAITEETSVCFVWKPPMGNSSSVMFISNDGSNVFNYYTGIDINECIIQKPDILQLAFLKDKKTDTFDTCSVGINNYYIGENKAVMFYNINSGANRYVLFDYKNNKTLSKEYTSMSTADKGETYLVQNDNGQLGYLDTEGNELGFFDDASDFVGDYAIVVYNGKGFFIDKKLNKVSDNFEFESVRALNDKLFIADSGNQKILIAKKRN